MHNAKYSLTYPVQINHPKSIHADFGFSDAGELLSKAIHLLKNEVEQEQKLEESALLYAEIYEEDSEAQEWVEASVKDWE